jgi:hypothetical protein
MFRAIDDSVEWFCRAVLLQVTALRVLSVMIRREQDYQMPPRVHDLVQGLFLGEAEEDPNMPLFLDSQEPCRQNRLATKR